MPIQAWGRTYVVGGVAAPSYSFRNNAGNNGAGSSTFSTSIDIGTAAADRLVIVGAGCQNGRVFSSAVVNGVTLNTDITHTNSMTCALCSGLVTSGSGLQSVSVTFTAASFDEIQLAVWIANGLVSNVVKNTLQFPGNGPGTISVTSGDLLFAFAMSTVANVPNFSGSTEAGTDHGFGPENGLGSDGADWTIISTNAAFSVTGTNINQAVVASYR